jgi:hypothetical protein
VKVRRADEIQGNVSGPPQWGNTCKIRLVAWGSEDKDFEVLALAFSPPIPRKTHHPYTQ